jgi:hypothetical protein
MLVYGLPGPTSYVAARASPAQKKAIAKIARAARTPYLPFLLHALISHHSQKKGHRYSIVIDLCPHRKGDFRQSARKEFWSERKREAAMDVLRENPDRPACVIELP